MLKYCTEEEILGEPEKADFFEVQKIKETRHSKVFPTRTNNLSFNSQTLPQNL